MIPSLMKRLVRWDKCLPEAIMFERCAGPMTWKAPFKCRDVIKGLRACEKRWFFDEAFVREVTERYLNERSEYRRSGKKQVLPSRESAREREQALKADLDARGIHFG